MVGFLQEPILWLDFKTEGIPVSDNFPAFHGVALCQGDKLSLGVGGEGC